MGKAQDPIRVAADRAIRLVQDEELPIGMAVATAAAEQGLSDAQALLVVDRIAERVKAQKALGLIS